MSLGPWKKGTKIAAIAHVAIIYSQPVIIYSSKTDVMGSGAAGQPMNSDNTSWPFTSPAGKDAAKPPKPHEIDLYIEPSPRDSPTALPKLFTTLEPTALPANAQGPIIIAR